MNNTGTPNFGNDAVKEYYKFLLLKYYKNWFWFVLAIAIAIGAAYYYLAITKPTYSIQGRILIKDDRYGQSSKESILKELDVFTPQKIIENEIEILKSNTINEKVINDLGLGVIYLDQSGLREKDLYKDSPLTVKVILPNAKTHQEPIAITLAGTTQVVIDEKTYPCGTPILTPYGTLQVTRLPNPQKINTIHVQLLPEATLVKAYQGRLKVTTAVRSSSVLVLAFEDTSPERGADYINRLIYFYDLASLEDKNKVAANTLKFVEDRLKLISTELTDVEKDIQNYKTTTGIVDLSAESSFFLDKVKENDALISQVNIRLGTLQELEKYVQAKPGNSSIVPATIGIEDPTLLGLIKQALDLELQREKITKTLPETSPGVEAIDNQLRTTKANIADNIQSLRKLIVNTQQKLQTSNTKLESVIRTIPQKERILLDISRQQAIKSNLYTYLLQKREETALSFASAVSDMRVVDPAKTDYVPIKPNRRLIFSIALIIGLILPTIGLWFLDFINNKVSRKAQIEEATEVPVIGEIVQAQIKTPLEVSPSSRSMLSEQIRALRTNIRFFNLNTQSDAQSILITSSISGEGKSFISLNLGASFAITDKKVLLMELDLRKPKIHKYLNVKNQKGLSTYLVGNASLDDVITQVPNYPNFFFIPCGPIPPNPAELLSSNQMNKLVGELKERFDVILMDTPPIGLVTDAQIMAPYADITVYVVRHLYTQKAFLKNVNILYKEKKFNNMSILINGIVLKKEYEYNYGYGYDYGYGYAYKYGYHTDEGQTKTGNGWLKKLRRLFSRSA